MAVPGRIRELVVGAGFAEPEIEEVSFRRPFADQDVYWRFLTETSSALSSALRALPGEARAAVWQQVHEVARPSHFGEGYDFPAVCLNVVTH
jgi:hypothetical protein